MIQNLNSGIVVKDVYRSWDWLFGQVWAIVSASSFFSCLEVVWSLDEIVCLM